MDTLDLFYRLAMTGLLIVAYPNSPNVRMIASLFVSFLMVSVVIVRPFVNESLNRVLIIGQFCVAMTIASGYVVETYTGKTNFVGVLLCLINSTVVLAAFWQSRHEHLHQMIDNLLSKPPKPIDAERFKHLWSDAGRGPLCDALLKSAEACLEVVGAGDLKECDAAWEYFCGVLLPLTDSDGRMVWEQVVPLTVDWVPRVQGAIDMALKLLKRDLEICLVPIHQGWLRKKGAINTHFRRRYFVLARVPRRRVGCHLGWYYFITARNKQPMLLLNTAMTRIRGTLTSRVCCT